jgi:sarcosine oxidase delta subunit
MPLARIDPAEGTHNHRQYHGSLCNRWLAHRRDAKDSDITCNFKRSRPTYNLAKRMHDLLHISRP